MKYLSCLSAFLILVSCASKQHPTHTSSSSNSAKPTTSSLSNTYNIFVKAYNLSEDMSTLSTQNDELILLIYENTQQPTLSSPLLAKTFVLSSSNREVNIPFNLSSKPEHLVIFLLEMDTDKNIEQIEPVIRVHYEQMMKDGLTYNDVSKYLGDDDILGYYKGEWTKKKLAVSFSGVQKMDRYDYEVGLE